MKIGDWDKTIQAEREYWEYAIGVWKEWNGLKKAKHIYMSYKAAVISDSLRCLDAVPTDESRILEVGGGLVDTMRWFEKGQLFAVEPLWEFFEGYRKGLSWEGLRTDVVHLGYKAEDLPEHVFIPDGYFDIVLILNTLDHCEDPEEVMRRIAAVTICGGLLYESTTVWGDSRDVDRSTLRLTHPHLFKGDELQELIEGNGFEEVEDPYCGKDINEPWTAHWQEGAWPTYLRVWRKNRRDRGLCVKD